MHLMHGLAVSAQEPRQPDTVGAGAFHAEADEPALGPDVALAEREQVGETGRCGGDEFLTHTAAEAVEHDGDVLVLVGVNADDDVVATKQHAGHRPWVSFTDPWSKPPVGRPDRTAMRPWSDQAPIRSLPARPAVTALLPRTADRSTPRHPQGRSQQGSDRRSSNNTILAVEARHFPAALMAFEDLDAPDALELLGRAPDPDQAAG